MAATKTAAPILSSGRGTVMSRCLPAADRDDLSAGSVLKVIAGKASVSDDGPWQMGVNTPSRTLHPREKRLDRGYDARCHWFECKWGAQITYAEQHPWELDHGNTYPTADEPSDLGYSSPNAEADSLSVAHSKPAC